MMCSSSAAFREPDPLNARRCPQASGAKRPRSCGPNTRKVMIAYLDASGFRTETIVKQEGEDFRCRRHQSSPCLIASFRMWKANLCMQAR
jgi:hypothetical protein